MAGLIANYNPVKYVIDDSVFGFRLDTENPAALTINTGAAGAIFTHTDSGGLVRSINYGTVGQIVTNGATTAEFGNAESINYGQAGNISTTTGASTGTATTRNEATGVAGDLSSSAINFANAVTINHGVRQKSDQHRDRWKRRYHQLRYRRHGQCDVRQSYGFDRQQRHDSVASPN